MSLLSEIPNRMSQPSNIQDIQSLQKYVSDLSIVISKLAKDLDYVVNGNIDDLNIRENSISAKSLDIKFLSDITDRMGEMVDGTFMDLTAATFRVEGSDSLGSYSLPDSTATTVEELSVEFNMLLQYLRLMGILSFE